MLDAFNLETNANRISYCDFFLLLT